MQVKKAMTDNVKLVDSDQSIREAAQLMAQLDCGCLPVAEQDHLVGMITDRDIAVRAVAEGMPLTTPIRDVMSPEVKYCFEDAELGEVAQNMADIKVRRLPVLNQQKRLVGILSLADVVLTEGAGCGGNALSGISAPGGEHSQSAVT